jgi:integrase
MRLTKVKLPAGKAEVIVFADDLKGFGVRVRAGGKRTWIAQYRIGAKQRRLTLGSLDKLDEAEARRRAKVALGKAQSGQDPQGEKVAARAQVTVTLGSVAEQYLARAEARLKPSSLVAMKHYLRDQWAPLAKMSLTKVTRAQIAARLNEITDASGPVSANRAASTLGTFYVWAISQGIADQNPVMGTSRNKEVTRDRVLTDEELALIWRHAGDDDYGRIVRLLMLTAQRREEVGGMGWPEIDLDKTLWSIPGARTKNGKAHDVPLSGLAGDIIKQVWRRDGRELVFGSREGAFSGWSKAKASLDTRIAAMQDMASWRLHDLRRTVATRMAEDCGVLPHVVEAVLNHISGHRGGVAGIYNRSTYAAEKRAALNLWAERLKAIVGLSSNIVTFPQKAG